MKKLFVLVLASATHIAIADVTLHHDADAIRRAAAGVKEAVLVAQRDPQRPIYHLRPAARWINDPNGCFYHDGWYHVFFQHNPYGDRWGHMHWGHARSRDNVHWERLPIAVWPDYAKGEDHCYSGSAVKDGYGNWQLWYTSVSKVRPKDADKGKLDWVFNGQVMLKPMDKDFIKWGKETADPVNDPTLPNNIDGYPWNKYIRDPSFFKVGDRTFMILGITGKGVPIYEAENKELTKWKYRGEMYDRNHDCVQMIPFPGDKWVYIFNKDYITGTFDPDTAKFTPLPGQQLRPLAGGNASYVVSHSINDKGEHTLYTWLRLNDNQGKGWNGCISLPVRLSLAEDGSLIQEPVPELKTLRGTHANAAVSNGSKVIAEGSAVEIQAEFENTSGGRCGLRICGADVVYENGSLNVMGHTVSGLKPEGSDETLNLHIFIDRSIAEVFINGGKQVVMQKFRPANPGNLAIECFAEGGPKGTVDVWQMNAIWEDAPHAGAEAQAAKIASTAEVAGATLLFENSDFEKGTLENWMAEGEAFTVQPTKGDNPAARNREPSMHQGDYWIGTHEKYDGRTGRPGDIRRDTPTGSLTSVPFKVTRPYICFLIGGGANSSQVGVRLICEGKEQYLAAGANSETMKRVYVDVKALIGKTARLSVMDQSGGGWGHINVDDFRASDAPIAREMKVGSSPFDNFHTYLDTGYDQPYRPLFHFTSRRNWINDPNGLLYYDGEYHLFFQHNPLGRGWNWRENRVRQQGWGNMTWGHAVSTDMVRWKQLSHAILPYGNGYIFSGSGVVDHNNSLGKQVSDTKTLVLLYTYAVDTRKNFGILPPPDETRYYQGMAYSTDRGRTFKLLNDGGPVIPNQGREVDKSGTERDPKFFWHEPSKKWVAVLWLGDGSGHVRFFNSDDLQNWKEVSNIKRAWAHECFDLVHLIVLDANGKPVSSGPEKKWLIYDANLDYEVGEFDGREWKADQEVRNHKLGQWKAAQTFNNSPDGRTVIVGWLKGSNFPANGMPFSQQLSFPAAMHLRKVGDEYFMCRYPIKEIAGLYEKTWQVPANSSVADANKKLAEVDAEGMDLSIKFDPKGKNLELDIRGQKLTYDAAKNEVVFGSDRLPNAMRDGSVRLRILVDRASFEIFLDGGITVLTRSLFPDLDKKSVSLTGTDAVIKSMTIHAIGSSWK